MKKGFFILVFMFFCLSAVFAAEIDIPLGNFGIKGISVDRIVVNTETNEASFFVTVPESYLHDFNDIKLEKLSRFYLNTLVSLNVGFRHLHILLRTDEAGEYKRVTEFLPKEPPVVTKEEEENGGVKPKTKKIKSLSPQVQHGNITGALSGKTLFVSAGHGWTYNINYNDSDAFVSEPGWRTQRDVSQGMREDDSNAEMVSYFLIPYLQNAGGMVFSARERDRQEKMVIIDEADGTNYADSDGIYEESGSWSDEGSDGFGYGRTTYPIAIDVNPLRSGKYRFAATGNGAWARWTANIPEDGFYHVYVAYRRGTNRTDKAVYTIQHAGGTSKVTVNQQHHGSTWIDLGRYYFRQGLSRENGSVTLSDSGESGAYLIADAVRFGGGTGLIKRGKTKTPTVSGKPRWEESAVHNVQFLGGTSGSVYHRSDTAYNDRDDDVSTRSRWAAWENEESDDSLYIAIHSNAVSDTSVTGLSTYIYSPGQGGGVGYTPGYAAEGSEELASLVHNRILNSVKALFNSNYKVYGNGLYSAYFGEINKNNNPEMPSVLVELAFHTSESDSKMLRNPKYRDIAMRAAYQAIVRYYADKDGTTPVFLPGSPRNLRTKVNENGSVTLSWDAPESDSPNYYKGHPAAGYYVQTSTDGVAFNDGVNVGNVLEWTKNFEENMPVYFRVVAYNAGGVSFPSAVAAAVPVKTGAQILLVDGFERIDNSMPRFNEGNSANHRYILENVNSFDYAKYYAPLLAELGYSLDFTQRANVAGMDLSKYDMILWFLGEQSTENETFNHAEQEKIAEYLNNGGALFVSGAEIGWDLDYKGSADDKSFFNETLNAKYVADESGLYTFFGADDFSTISGSFDDGTYIYQAEYADVLAPFDENAGKKVLFYDNSKTLGAGILTKTNSKKVFVMGFPFETILEKGNKINLLQFVLDEFEITPENDDDPADTSDTENENPDADSSDTGDENDEDTADTGDEKPGEDPADSSDSADTSDSSDSADPTDSTSDSTETSESSESDEEKGGKGGCALITL
ncbi:N-acetylmuramoyl-L-alanine amidase [bacterium]|nr:N-acetylmuramoyl-L-alanine amidase [bacterium]